jgi:hypothetical protein
MLLIIVYNDYAEINHQILIFTGSFKIKKIVLKERVKK